VDHQPDIRTLAEGMHSEEPWTMSRSWRMLSREGRNYEQSGDPGEQLSGRLVASHRIKGLPPDGRQAVSTPELWSVGLKTQAYLNAALLAFSYVDDLAKLFVKSTDVSHHHALAEIDWLRQGDETTMSTEYESMGEV
jgi:hypothetical protein